MLKLSSLSASHMKRRLQLPPPKQLLLLSKRVAILPPLPVQRRLWFHLCCLRHRRHQVSRGLPA
jgi:hypothetical protein